MWLRKGDGAAVLVPDSMPDTIKRCLGDGWVEVADPRVVRETVPALAAQSEQPPPSPQPEPRRAAVRQRGRR